MKIIWGLLFFCFCNQASQFPNQYISFFLESDSDDDIVLEASQEDSGTILERYQKNYPFIVKHKVSETASAPTEVHIDDDTNMVFDEEDDECRTKKCEIISDILHFQELIYNLIYTLENLSQYGPLPAIVSYTKKYNTAIELHSDLVIKLRTLHPPRRTPSSAQIFNFPGPSIPISEWPQIIDGKVQVERPMTGPEYLDRTRDFVPRRCYWL